MVMMIKTTRSDRQTDRKTETDSDRRPVLWELRQCRNETVLERDS